MITPEEFSQEMKRIAEIDDQETGHVKADELMLLVLRQLGYGDGADIFDKMSKWYS